MATRVRLIDIAERLHITKVSVSKALRDHPDISRETRDLVKKTAAEMGYSPNLLARSLSSRKTNTLGAVVPKIAHSFFASAIDAIQEKATEKGYGIVLAVSNERADLERQHIERLLAMRVDGLLVSVSQEAPHLDVYKKIMSMRVPMVFFDRRIDSLPFASVTVDDRGGARQAVESMIDEGFTRIAHIAGSLDTEIGRARLKGYEDALRARGLPVRDEWVIGGGFDEQHGYGACRRLLELDGEPPDVIFAATFPVSLGVRAALKEIDPSQLDRIQTLAFGVGSFEEFYLYPHYCVSQPTREMGREAVRILLDQIDALDDGGALPDAEHLVLETTLMFPTDAHGLGGGDRLSSGARAPANPGAEAVEAGVISSPSLSSSSSASSSTSTSSACSASSASSASSSASASSAIAPSSAASRSQISGSGAG